MILEKGANYLMLIILFKRLLQKQVSEGTSIEYWYARDLLQILGYDRWENFTNIIGKAKTSCQVADAKIDNHFRDVTKMVYSIRSFIPNSYSSWA